MIVNTSLYPLSGSMRAISDMNRQFESLQLQLATGKRYNTLAEMGSDRLHDLNLRARLGRIEGFQANILTVETRLGFHTNAIQRLDEIEAEARKLATPGAYGTDGINFMTARNQATNLLKEVIDVLNTDITGQYIFGGNASDRKPVASFDEIMKGPGGFEQFVVQRQALDGVDARGNVSIGGTGTSVTISEDTADPHGFKLAIAEAGAGPVTIAKTSTDPDPQAFTLTFASQPEPGQTVSIGVRYPHDPDTVKYLTFTAVSGDTDPVPEGSFRIGATPEDTAAEFGAKLGERLDTLAGTTLKSSSTYAAADRFFTANGESQASGTTSWYLGQSSDNPRQSVSVNIDEHTRAHYGVQANEHGFVELIKGLAVFAVSDLSPLDSDNAARYEQLVEIQRGRLSESNNSVPGSIEGIAMELGLAASSINTVKARHVQYDAQLKTMLGEIETAPREEVAMMLLQIQVQLQASYQATAMASQLTLVNYLR